MQPEGLFGQHIWRLVDQSKTHSSFHALYSFAMDDTLCTSVQQGISPAVVRTWVHHQNIVLGNVDTKLTRLADGLAYLRECGYMPIVRNSGGAAVVLDTEVLNVSLILPTTDAFSDIHAGYRAMVEFIRLLLAPYGAVVDTGEVVGSYCPGDFDVSIGGRKFGGLAQRRRRGAVAVQAFLLANGSGAQRAELVKRFYSISAVEGDAYPDVNPGTLASLSELLGVTISCADLQARIAEVLAEKADEVRTSVQLLPQELEEFNRNLAGMQARNPQLEL
ncbi:lipoate--protein ligase family protein [Aneurinibacillus uraniidurans]|uniref:lipoate--protein ligase family protein n=1 Tax=Aneurinibacillus uraniidurans TaxID=2966586 RepID=UPI0023499D4C|nr:lipoate--protein ligase family protein [Aneurinibacillus sp. B1]WCN38588.1 lipoate--protein ligase family protein [Aneurinibacillus sp. B1]